MPHLRIVHLKIEDTGPISQAQQPLQTQIDSDIRITRSGKRYSKEVINNNQNTPKLSTKKTTRTYKQEDTITAIHLIPTHPPTHTQIIKQEENNQPQPTYPHTYLSPSEVKQEEFSPPHTHLIKLEDPPTPIHTLSRLQDIHRPDPHLSYK